jgi:ATP-dependent helicase HrpA
MSIDENWDLISQASRSEPNCSTERIVFAVRLIDFAYNRRMADAARATNRPRRLPDDPDAPGQARYDAIHRALLAGLLGNVGTKSRTDEHEYLAARGKKFHLFPGSALFRKRPPWVMAAELAETTRLYARTVARIDPQWIERVGDHLVQRTYNEPHWQMETAHVVAYERVTLHGLVIVARRRVHYGPIDPRAAREIFIRAALVEGEYHTDAPYFRHNASLLREIGLTEAKLRRRDVLVDAESRFAFYAARVPAGIYNGPLFEKWRRNAEAKDRRVLFMTRQDLVASGPDNVAAPPNLFPDSIVVPEMNDLRLALSYRYDTSDPADGVTATVPLAALNQLAARQFDWLVPGWLEEKIAALIKTLPKDLRTHFIPAPDTARAIAPLLHFGQGDLLASIAWQLGRRSEVHVPRDAWQPEALPDWLRMNFVIIDEAGKPIETGRDLEQIRGKLRIEVKETFASLPQSEWHRDGITRWDFADLPEQVEVVRPGITLRGFPALVDAGESVSLRLMDTLEAARASMRGGLRRLFALQLAEQMKYLARNLPGIDRMALHYATIGPSADLRRDLIGVITDRALFSDEDESLIRKKEEFVARAESGWRRLSVATAEVCEVVEQTLAGHQDLARQLQGTFAPLLAPSIADIRQQLGALLPRGFVTATPFHWLRQFPRYLKAADLRLRKLTNAGASRDLVVMQEITPLWQQYVRRAELHRLRGTSDPALAQYRWMLEELRVSLFAQELKTSVPVSAKRLQGLWEQVKAPGG